MHEDQLRRYSRNIKLPEIGEEGQKKLLRSKVLVIGAGGLGSPVLLYLAAAGVGKIGIIDNDRVDLTNLQRQTIHETGDIDRPKVESARDAIHDLNPDITVEIYNERIDEKNAHALISRYDIVADGSDNFATRFLVNDVCREVGVTLISAAINRFEGQLSTFKTGGPCYRCIYPDIPPADTMPSCSEAGVFGSVAGVMGAWQTTEVIKELLGIGESLSGSLIVFNALKGESRKIKVNKDIKCKTCSNIEPSSDKARMQAR